MLTPSPAPRATLRAMLVEDSPTMQELLIDSLATVPGLEIVGVAETVADAVAEFESQGPDVVVLDLSLREGSGLDVLRVIKVRNPECQVLVFTGHDQPSYRQHCLAAGADFFFSKNRQHDELIQHLRAQTKGAPIDRTESQAPSAE